MFRVVCIDDANRPPDIPTTNWIQKDKEYTVLKVGKNKLNGDEYFILQEVQPTPPYGGYKVDRFRLPHPQSIESQYEKQALEVF